jgi:hypothetical protein
MRVSSQPSSIDPSRVCDPICWAAIWSTETPFLMSAPEVLRQWTPVRNTAPARAWSPGPSPSALPLLCSRPDSTSTRSFTGASGFRMRDSSQFAPSAAGVHDSIVTPFGT